LIHLKCIPPPLTASISSHLPPLLGISSFNEADGGGEGEGGYQMRLAWLVEDGTLLRATAVLSPLLISESGLRQPTLRGLVVDELTSPLVAPPLT